MEHNAPEFEERIAGFRRMLERALAARTPGSSRARADLYDQARDALARHLEATGLSADDPAVLEQGQALEEAIAQVEAAQPAAPRPQGVPPEQTAAPRADEKAEGAVTHDDAERAKVGSAIAGEPTQQTGMAAAPAAGRRDAPSSEAPVATASAPDDTFVEPGLFDGAVEIADDRPPLAPVRPKRALPALGLALAVLLLLGTAAAFLVGDPRRAGADRRLEAIGLRPEAANPPVQVLTAVSETPVAQGPPPPALIEGERGAATETGTVTRTGVGAADRVLVAFPEAGLALAFEIGIDRAPNGTTREVIRVEVEDAPEPIFNLAGPWLVLPGEERTRTIDTMPVRLGMRRAVIGFMEPVGPLLREAGADHVLLGFPVRLESGRRLTLVVPFTADQFAFD